MNNALDNAGCATQPDGPLKEYLKHKYVKDGLQVVHGQLVQAITNVRKYSKYIIAVTLAY